MSHSEFESAESWSVEYGDLVYDDARQIGDVWYYCDPLTNEILRFRFQHHVVLLDRNVNQTPRRRPVSKAASASSVTAPRVSHKANGVKGKARGHGA